MVLMVHKKSWSRNSSYFQFPLILVNGGLVDYKCSASTARRLFIGPQDFLYSHMWSVCTFLSLPFSFLPSMKDKVSFDLVFYKYNRIPLFSLSHSCSDGYSDRERERERESVGECLLLLSPPCQIQGMWKRCFL